LESSLAYAEANLRDRRESAQRRAEANAAATHVTMTPVQPEQPTALERAQTELSRLESRYYASHPEVERMRAEVRRLEREEAASTPGGRATQTTPATTQAANDAGAGRPRANGPDEEFQAESNRIQDLKAQRGLVEGEIRSLEDRQQRVLQEMAQSQERMRNLPVREQQMAVITRDYDTSKANYQNLLNKKLAADVAADMERWHKSQKFTMLDPARVPQKPTSPRRTMLTAAGGLLSLALGTGLAFLLELKRNTLLGEWELPADVLVIGRIPQMKLENL